MTARFSGERLGQWLGEDLSPLVVLVCAAAMYFADWAFLQTGGAFWPGALLDETAHILTALLLLQAVPPRWRKQIVVPALIASVAIDLDHLPQYLGHDLLMVRTSGRPATHSLLTPLVFLALALMLPKHRKLLLGLVIGLMLHFFRDLAEGNGSGVSLLWPLNDVSFSSSHATYLALMAGVVVVDVGLGFLSLRRQRVAAQ